ncbi:GntR family transcriptional regulator [Xanthobacter sp. VNH20]|uniref:GntR family transcriptional regulator n=1 Tax=Xanthobacter sp. VNH20 TaxID=3156616 RepID=UPI0032B50457
MAQTGKDRAVAKPAAGRRPRAAGEGGKPSKSALSKAAPPKSASQTDAAVELIRAKIIDMSLEPSSRIDEALLINKFKLGRTPAREAINRLAAEGMVYIAPNRGGIYVRKLDFREIHEVVVAYQIAESISAQLCRFEDSTLLDDLKAIEARYEREVHKRAYLDITRLNEEFHLRISRSIGNSLFFEFSRSAHRHVRRLLVMIYKVEEAEGPRLDEQFDVNLKEHDEIIAALEARDRAALTTLMPAHARQTQKRLLRILSETTLKPPGLDADLIRFASGPSEAVSPKG